MGGDSGTRIITSNFIEVKITSIVWAIHLEANCLNFFRS